MNFVIKPSRRAACGGSPGSINAKLSTCNFRPGAEPDRIMVVPDAAVDAELAAGFVEPSADVGRLQSGEGDAAAEELERQLAAVGVPG